MADRDWTEEELERVEERDQLAVKKWRSEVGQEEPALTAEEQARLDELNAWLDTLYPEPPGLPQEVLQIIDEVLGKDRG